LLGEFKMNQVALDTNAVQGSPYQKACIEVGREFVHGSSITSKKKDVPKPVPSNVAASGSDLRITGMIIGLRPVVFWISRFNSARTFSFTMP